MTNEVLIFKSARYSIFKELGEDKILHLIKIKIVVIGNTQFYIFKLGLLKLNLSYDLFPIVIFGMSLSKCIITIIMII